MGYTCSTKVESVMRDLQEYAWCVAFGAIAAIFAAFGIGANDVANAYATSVGSKALTVKQACALAVIFEFAGAVLVGSSVADTIRKGIADYKCFDDSYMDLAILMYGNLCVVGSVGIWLLVASWAEMPVSTTHSCVGGMIGMTIVAKGSGCVVWLKETDADSLYIPKGVVGIVLSWIFSPVLSAVFSVLLFLVVRSCILRRSGSFGKAVTFYPILIIFAVWINAFFVISKGIKKKICPDWDPFLCDGKSVKGWNAMGVGLGIGVLCGFCSIPMVAKIRTMVNNEFEERERDPEAAAAKEKAAKEKKANNTKDRSQMTWTEKAQAAVMTSLNADPHDS